MSDREQLLRDALDRARAGDEAAAEERAWRVLAAAEAPAARPLRTRRTRRTRRVVQVGLALALIALVVSPAGASVRHWVAERIEPGAPHATPVLSSLPGDGSLLVDSAQGPWVVHPDGSKRLLGDYAEASWSPHGLFAVVTEGHELTAVEPDGTVRWSLTRPGRVKFGRWNGPDGFRIAYLEFRELRVVDGDGSGDRQIARGVEPIAPAWRPGPEHELAFATGRGAVVTVDADSGAKVFGRPREPGVSRVTSLQWAGDRLLVTRLDRVQLLDAQGLPVWTWTPPSGSHVRAATLAPGGDRVAIVTGEGSSSRVLLVTPRHRSRVLFAGPGHFAAPRWSPDGRWLLLPWPSADQWLFLQPAGRAAKLHAVAHVAEQFSPGEAGAARFPEVAGWCCTR